MSADIREHLRRCREKLGERIASARFTDYSRFERWWDGVNLDSRRRLCLHAKIFGQGVEHYPWSNFSPAEQDALAREAFREWVAVHDFPGEVIA